MISNINEELHGPISFLVWYKNQAPHWLHHQSTAQAPLARNPLFFIPSRVYTHNLRELRCWSNKPKRAPKIPCSSIQCVFSESILEESYLFVLVRGYDHTYRLCIAWSVHRPRMFYLFFLHISSKSQQFGMFSLLLREKVMRLVTFVWLEFNIF